MIELTKYTALFMIFLLAVVSCQKENKIQPEQKEVFVKLFGNSFEDRGHDIKQTADGGYILTGYITTTGGDKDVLLIKTDEYGNQQWSKTFGDSLDDMGYSLQIVPGEGYAVLGTLTQEDGTTDMYLLKTDASGNEQWSKKIGTGSNEAGYCLRICAQGGFILAGSTTQANTVNGNPQGNTDFYLVKTDAAGTVEWSKAIGGSQNESAKCIVQKPSDNGYIIIGSTTSFSLSGQTGSNVFLVETNEFGVESGGSNTFGGMGDDFGNSLCMLDDGTCIFTGITYTQGNADVFVVKLGNNIHTAEWTKTFGGEKYDGGEDICAAGDGYIIAGTSESNSNGGTDMYLLKIDKSGNEIFSNNFGGSGNEEAKALTITTDDGYAFTGFTFFENNSMMNLVKTRSNGKMKE